MANRRPAGDGMVRQKKRGQWEGGITVGHKSDGKPIFRYVYGKTQKETLEKLHQRIEDYRGVELTSGLRRGELLALLWADLNVEERTISVSKSVGRVKGEIIVAPPKTQNSIRTVVIPQQAVDLLVEDRKNHPDSKYLFPSPHTGEMWSPDAVGRLHKKILRAAGIDERVRFHDLRHTFATLALQTGADVKTVSSMLGHYSAGFTMDTYTHVTNHMQLQAADKMGSFMDTALPETAPTPPEPPESSGCKVIPFEMVG